ncbi:pyridoxal phosphate-dependent decarboxylase family protein [Parafrankia elaeagni]|uniref:pyridoxal phosphate-dependent decarboxylase family protein n=1 Tax=Parafrankia elaeagni TaxID=222534 RepID=UPI00036B374B|nr:pyridoxal-dependent decarboxylase [Parafrankia elaeagni]
MTEDHSNGTSGNEAAAPGEKSFLGEPLEENLLAPDDGNLTLLADRLRELVAAVKIKRGPRQAQFSGVDFSYPGPDEWPEIPSEGMDRESALTVALEGFDGSFRANSPDLMFNLCPSPLIDAVAIASLTMQINPNAIWDLTSGRFGLVEERCIRRLAGLVGWGQDVGGTFTSGGKSTLMYAIRHGLRRIAPETVDEGIRRPYRVLISPFAHYSIESACNWLGLGRGSCRRVPADARGEMDVAALENELRVAISEEVIVPVVLASGGSLIDTRVDDLAGIRAVIDRVSGEHGLAVPPHLHADTVVTWPWLAIRHQDWHLDDLNPSLRASILEVSTRLDGVRFADSFGVDFHKTGLAAYSSSCYVTRRGHSLSRLESPVEGPAPFLRRQGDRSSYQWTMDNSRSCTGIVMAEFVLARLGRSGLSEYVTRLMSVSRLYRELLSDSFRDLGEIVNHGSLGMDIVVRLALSTSADDPSYPDVCESFRQWITFSAYAESHSLLLPGYVPSYRGGPPAFLLLPSSLYTDKASATASLERLRSALVVFRNASGYEGVADLDKESLEVEVKAWRGRPVPPR